MIDARVARAVLRYVEGQQGSANYLQIRTALTATMGVANELVIWNEVQELINVDKALDNGGVNPGDRDRLTVTLQSPGRAILNRDKLESLSFDEPTTSPEDGNVPQKPKPKPRELEW